MLADADLVTLHEHLMSLNMYDDNKALAELFKLRKSEKQWSESYETYVQKSMELTIKI